MNQTFKTPRPPTLLGLSKDYVAFPSENRLSVIVAPLSQEEGEEEIEIEGHKQKITAIAMNTSNQLCSASSDCLMLCGLNSDSPSCVILSEQIGEVNSLSFPKIDDNYLLVCVSHDVQIFDLKQKKLYCALGPHKSNAICCGANRKAQLVFVCCEDGSISIWDSATKTLINELLISPGIPLLSISIGLPIQSGAITPICVGSQDSKAFILEFHDNDIHLIQTNIIPQSQSPVIATYCCSNPSGFLFATQESVHAIASGVWKDELVLSFTSTNQQQPRLAATASFCIDDRFTGGNSGKILCAAGSAFESFLDVFKVKLPWMNSTDKAASSAIQINIFTEPIQQNSPLRTKLIKANTTQSTTIAPSPTSTSSPKKQQAQQSQPVMFHSKVRSSGYGTPPVRKMFSPKLNKPITANGTQIKQPKPEPIYPLGCEFPSRLLQNEVEQGSKLHGGAISCVRFGGIHDKLLLTCSSDNHGRASKIPLSKHKGLGSLVLSHTSAVTGIEGSYEGNHAITTSLDQIVKLWVLSDPKTPKTSKSPSLVQILKGSAALEINNPKGSQEQGNSSFTSPIPQASFFFQDKFISIAYGSSLLFYAYLIDIESSDAKRLQNHSRSKVVTQITEENKITCFGCNNSLSSSIAICATTDHSLSVHDIATGAMIHRVTGAHDRPIHKISLIKVGYGTNLPSEAYNTFVTVSVDNCLKLWDLRTVSSVRRFEGHINRTHKIGASISPCAKFIAVGSEDKNVCIYDIGQGTILSKLHGHTDVVSDVAFNTYTSLLASCSHDGSVHFFSP